MRLDDSGPASSVERRHHGQPDAQRLGARGQEMGVAAAPVAEGEIRPADQVAGADALVQHLVETKVSAVLSLNWLSNGIS